MIALCSIHHAHADADAFTKEQLHQFKLAGATRTSVEGKLNWMRNELLAVVGGSLYYKTPVVFQFRGQPIIFFNRDREGYQLLNLRMLTTSGEPRAVIKDNYWLSVGRPEDLESPPSGKLLRVKYANGDMVKVEFREIATADDLTRRYPHAASLVQEMVFPVTTVEVQNNVGGIELKFGPRKTKIAGLTLEAGSFSNGGVGLSVG